MVVSELAAVSELDVVFEAQAWAHLVALDREA